MVVVLPASMWAMMPMLRIERRSECEGSLSMMTSSLIRSNGELEIDRPRAAPVAFPTRRISTTPAYRVTAGETARVAGAGPFALLVRQTPLNLQNYPNVG